MRISGTMKPQRAIEARAVEREMEHVFALLSDRRIGGEARVELENRGSLLRAKYRELIRGPQISEGRQVS